MFHVSTVPTDVPILRKGTPSRVNFYVLLLFLWTTSDNSFLSCVACLVCLFGMFCMFYVFCVFCVFCVFLAIFHGFSSRLCVLFSFFFWLFDVFCQLFAASSIQTLLIYGAGCSTARVVLPWLFVTLLLDVFLLYIIQ